MQQTTKKKGIGYYRELTKNMLDIGITDSTLTKAYDIIYALSILINLFASIALTYDNVAAQYGSTLKTIEAITVAFFTLDCILRLWAAKYFFKDLTELQAITKYIFSFNGIIDILSFLPYWLPIFFPAGTAAFRAFRIVRIFRLFRINSYYDSVSVIGDALNSKKQQLISSVFIIMVLMLASSLCMYSLEHEAQPTVFENAFSGMWWSVSTLLTVGYGDIYPITFMGKTFGIFITFLGVAFVAIPTGIISAGFVDQYSRIKKMSEYAAVEEIEFIKLTISDRDRWAGQKIKDIGLPHGLIVAAIHRKGEVVIPRGDVDILSGDVVVLGAESINDDHEMELKEVILKESHDWNGKMIRELDISRQTVVVMVKRKNKSLIPSGHMKLQVGDKVFLYSKSKHDLETLS